MTPYESPLGVPLGGHARYGMKAVAQGYVNLWESTYNGDGDDRCVL